MPENLYIKISGRYISYPIVYQSATGDTVKKLIGAQVGSTSRRIALITDSNVLGLDKTQVLLRGLGISAQDALSFPAGEASKNRNTFNTLQDGLLERKFGRDSILIALGGGVVGDMAGLVADQHNRGIPLMQIPTTVLAQADSSIGGKVGIDVGEQKNAIGAFKHPHAVIIDTDWLSTLSDEQYRNGMAETVKHGILADRSFFDWLVANREDIIARSTDDNFIARTNCGIKGEVVQEDPEEKGRRKTLNYGHTAGHAIEAASRYSLPHGYCVAIGMQVAAKIAILMKTGFTEGDFREQTGLLQALKLPIYIPSALEIDHLLEIMRGDKKNEAGKTNFALPKTIGAMHDFGGKWATPVNEGMIREVLMELQDKK